MEYRLATPEEIPTLRELRKIQLIEEGHKPDINMDAELDEFFARRMADTRSPLGGTTHSRRQAATVSASVRANCAKRSNSA